MDLEMVLNELSLQSPANDVQIARQWMTDFTSTVQKATRQGVKRVIRTEYNIHSTLLSYENGYTVGRWLRDDKVDQVARDFFLGLVTLEPFLADIIDDEMKDKFASSQFWHLEDEVKGLGVAFLCEALALSVRSHSRWHPSHLELKFIYLDDNGEIIEDPVEVIHASCVDHVLEHADWIKDRTRIQVHDGSDLWNRRRELFPNLQFCESAGEQIQSLLHGYIMLRPVLKKLLELENYCNTWRDGPFSTENFPCKVNLDGETTLKKFARERTFSCLDGKERVFSWHTPLTPNAWRIHFFPKEEARQLIIGYIGPHLHIASDPT